MNERKMSEIAKYNKEFEKIQQKMQLNTNNKSEMEILSLQSEIQ